jgi:AraC-like DNA-binding protein
MSYSRRALMEAISATLHQHPAYGLDDIAAALNVSRRTIQSTIKDLKDLSFTEFRDEIAHTALAAEFQRLPTCSISDIVYKLGFPSCKMASRMLFRSRGLTLSQLRTQAVNCCLQELSQE